MSQEPATEQQWALTPLTSGQVEICMSPDVQGPPPAALTQTPQTKGKSQKQYSGGGLSTRAKSAKRLDTTTWDGSALPFELPVGALQKDIQVPQARLDRIQTLGREMRPWDRFALYYGICLTLVDKITDTMVLIRFAKRAAYAEFTCVLGFILMSGIAVTFYMLEHYPWRSRNAKTTEERELKVLYHVQMKVLGVVCAMFQLGTVYAALRALHTKEALQRKKHMDFLGMRLVDMMVQTLPQICLQVFLGISTDALAPGRPNFDLVLFVSVFSGLSSAMGGFFAMEKEVDILYPFFWLWGKLRRKTVLWYQMSADDKHYFAKLITVCVHRFFELSSRVIWIALFASVTGAGIFGILFFHAIAVLMLMRSTHAHLPNRGFWGKLCKTRVMSLCGRKVHLPAWDDAKLLALCMVWPPSGWVSDATDSRGRFWWRSDNMGEQKSFSELTNGIVPAQYYNWLIMVETFVMYVGVAVLMDPWMDIYLRIAVGCTMAWLVSAISLRDLYINGADYDDHDDDTLEGGAMMMAPAGEARAGAAGAALRAAGAGTGKPKTPGRGVAFADVTNGQQQPADPKMRHSVATMGGGGATPSGFTRPLAPMDPLASPAVAIMAPGAGAGAATPQGAFHPKTPGAMATPGTPGSALYSDISTPDSTANGGAARTPAPTTPGGQSSLSPVIESGGTPGGGSSMSGGSSGGRSGDSGMRTPIRGSGSSTSPPLGGRMLLTTPGAATPGAVRRGGGGFAPGSASGCSSAASGSSSAGGTEGYASHGGCSEASEGAWNGEEDDLMDDGTMVDPGVLSDSPECVYPSVLGARGAAGGQWGSFEAAPAPHLSKAAAAEEARRRQSDVTHLRQRPATAPSPGGTAGAGGMMGNPLAASIPVSFNPGPISFFGRLQASIKDLNAETATPSRYGRGASDMDSM